MDIDERTKAYLQSKDPEMYQLGLQICKVKYPALWCGLLNFTGVGELDETALKLISQNPYINIGTRVRYRGMEKSPTMVVVAMKIDSQKLSSTKIGFFTVLTVKYFNTSSQSFVSQTDRIECFEVLDDEE